MAKGKADVQGSYCVILGIRTMVLMTDCVRRPPCALRHSAWFYLYGVLCLLLTFYQ